MPSYSPLTDPDATLDRWDGSPIRCAPAFISPPPASNPGTEGRSPCEKFFPYPPKDRVDGPHGGGVRRGGESCSWHSSIGTDCGQPWPAPSPRARDAPRPSTAICGFICGRGAPASKSMACASTIRRGRTASSCSAPNASPSVSVSVGCCAGRSFCRGWICESPSSICNVTPRAARAGSWAPGQARPIHDTRPAKLPTIRRLLVEDGKLHVVDQIRKLTFSGSLIAAEQVRTRATLGIQAAMLRHAQRETVQTRGQRRPAP